jgi:hypothetical protein
MMGSSEYGGSRGQALANHAPCQRTGQENFGDKRGSTLLVCARNMVSIRQGMRTYSVVASCGRNRWMRSPFPGIPHVAISDKKCSYNWTKGNGRVVTIVPWHPLNTSHIGGERDVQDKTNDLHLPGNYLLARLASNWSCRAFLVYPAKGQDTATSVGTIDNGAQ